MLNCSFKEEKENEMQRKWDEERGKQFITSDRGAATVILWSSLWKPASISQCEVANKHFEEPTPTEKKLFGL